MNKRASVASKTVTATVLKADLINHPPHYTHGKFEVIDVIEDWKLGFHLGNTLKYVARAAHKGSELDDLNKARWYLERYIEQCKQRQ